MALVVGGGSWPGQATSPHLAAPPDFAGFYRAGPAHLAPVLRREGDSLRIFLNRAAPALGSAAPQLRLSAWPSYEAAQPLWEEARPLRPYPSSDPAAPVQVLTAAVAASRLAAGQVLQVSLELPSPTAAASSVAGAASPTSAAQYPATTAWLSLSAEQLARPFVLLDSTGLVLDRPYVRAGAGVAVATFGLSQLVRWRRYPAGAPALPPFADPRTQPAPPRTLAVLDSGAAPVVAGTLLRFAQPGLVAFKVGGLGGEPARTVPLLVARADFPGQTTANELIENLLYITTATERRELATSPDPKRAVDRFWLRAAGSDQEHARRLIRSYYGRITAANELFSGHKAGWRTDRGLLYVVLGPPQRVSRPAGEEHWYYDHAGHLGEAVTFTFRARPTTLAPDNYELVRRPEYQPLWNAAVDQWRNPLSVR
ncbi:MAG: GWxTD domain-containing protein [Janthinobacterium lividum]